MVGYHFPISILSSSAIFFFSKISCASLSSQNLYLSNLPPDFSNVHSPIPFPSHSFLTWAPPGPLFRPNKYRTLIWWSNQWMVHTTYGGIITARSFWHWLVTVGPTSSMATVPCCSNVSKANGSSTLCKSSDRVFPWE